MQGTLPRRRVLQAGPLARYLVLALLAFSAALAILRTSEDVAADTASVKPLYIPRIELLRPALLGFRGLAADLTWLRTIQYFGGRVERQQKFPQLYLLVDSTTSLDPDFLDAYVYGGLFLVIAKQYPQAITIYRKGVTALPGAWQLPHDLGRLYYLEIRDYEQALYWWKIAERLPGHPHYLRRFIARLNAKIGHLETARELWQEFLQTTTNEWYRQLAAQELAKLEGHHGSPARP
jgi:tetratricopeptide (TPR) repeat protein